MSNESVAIDHPERLGRLAEVFVRRRIAFAVDGRGELVLLRPDSVVVDLGETEEAFQAALAAIRRYDERQAAEIGQSDRRRGRLAAVRVPNEEPIAVHGERRWSVGPVQRALEALRGAGAVAEPNHVVLGSQVVRGMPVGGQTYFAGGMMFTADIVDTDKGPVLKTTSDPAVEPAWLPQPLALAGHVAPKVLILDTGLRTADGQGASVEHPYLTAARLHSPWLQAAPAGAIDDEDEFDDDDTGTLDFEAGHGTFITGIIQQICPDAEVHIAGVLSSFGDGDVANVVAAFELAVATAGPFDLVVMSLGGYMSDDDGELFGAAIHRLLGDGLVHLGGRQPVDVASVLPSSPPRDRGRRWPRRERQGLVHELRRLGRCMCTGHRRRQHVLRRPQREARRAIDRVGSLERHELRGPEGGRRDREGDVPHR